MFSFLFILPFILCLIYFPFQNEYPEVIRTILLVLLIISVVVWPIILPLVIVFISTPKTQLPKRINLLSFNNDIICNQKSHSVYEVILYNKVLTIDMSSWLFKKLYIRDIMLLYYHLDYYNRNKLNSFKCNSKKYFKDENKYIVYNMLNGKTKKIPMIKNGIEKRTIICSLKLLLLSSSLDRRNRYKKDKHYVNEVINFYL